MHGHETFGEPDQRLLTAATSSPVAFRAAPWRCGAALKENGVSRPRHSQAREETETPPSAASLIILHLKLPIIVTAHTGSRNGTHLSRARTSRLAQAQRRPERHPRFCWNATASAAVAAPVHPRLPFRSLPNRPCSQLPNVRSVRCTPVRNASESRAAFPLPRLYAHARRAALRPLRRGRTAGRARRVEDCATGQVHRCAASAPFVVNDARLLPRVRIKHLASLRANDVCPTTGTFVTPCVPHCLRPSAKAPDSRALDYRAANWVRVGKPQGRGKLDVKNALPVKDAEAPAAGLKDGSQCGPSPG